MVELALAVFAVAFSLIFVNAAYAETTIDKQITISKDLQNNPVAQDILEKIEKSKKWISKIEQRNFEALEKEKELEAKRTEVLQILEKDLKKWEKLWEYHTFDSMLARSLANDPANATSTIHDHPLKFTASKINAGRVALDKVLQDGGGPEEARTAFVNAAKITRAEMISTNSLYNVIHNNAYYNQQILFDSNGQFDLILSGEKLRKYYQDYRTNPSYLQSNPLDKTSWEDLGKNSPATECRLGYVLVYRHHASDYVCTTQYTAEMWVRHNMGNVVNSKFLETNTPDNIEQLQQDRTFEKVKNINSKINSIQKHYEKNISDKKIDYASLFSNMDEKKNQEEKKLLEKFHESNSMSKENLSHGISDIREKYKQLKESVTSEKSRVLKILEAQHQTNIDNLVTNYDSDSEIRINWNSQNPIFEANMS